jgi:hypothetical protein
VFNTARQWLRTLSLLLVHDDLEVRLTEALPWVLAATFCHAGTTPAEVSKTSASLARATKRQRDKSTAFARTTSLHVGRQVTFSPGADVMAAALMEGIHLVSTG